MRNVLIRLARSHTLKLLAAGAAVISGIDDLVEVYFGVQDLFGLDVAHGLIATALTGILEPMSKLIAEGHREISRIEDEQQENQAGE